MSRFEHVLQEARDIAEGRSEMQPTAGHLAAVLLAHDDVRARLAVCRTALVEGMQSDGATREAHSTIEHAPQGAGV
jgi:hypothetical protein